MFGCDMRPTACASLRKRSAVDEPDRSSPTRCLRIVLIATGRWITGSKALYTTPMAPSPITPVIGYLPSCSGCFMAARGISLQEFQGMHQALAHAREGFGQNA